MGIILHRSVGTGAKQSACGICCTSTFDRGAVGHEQDVDSSVGNCAQPVDRLVTLNGDPLVRRPDVYTATTAAVS
jgi:hypothetical protein